MLGDTRFPLAGDWRWCGTGCWTCESANWTNCTAGSNQIKKLEAAHVTHHGAVAYGLNSSSQPKANQMLTLSTKRMTRTTILFVTRDARMETADDVSPNHTCMSISVTNTAP